MERGETEIIVNLDGNGIEQCKATSSSFFLSQSQSQSQDQVEAETETESGQGSNVQETSVNYLPPEMLMQVLKYVDTRTLFQCHLVNPQWSEIASEILTTRSDAKINFQFADNLFFQKRAKVDRQKTSLNRFLLCMKNSKSCPFSRFAVSCNNRGSYFNHEECKAFISAVEVLQKTQNQNSNPTIKIKSLEFEFKNQQIKKLKVLIDLLRDLLHKIPHLEELGLSFPQLLWNEKHPKLKFFPETADKTVVQLPHLKTIHFHPSMIFKIPGVLKELLNAAVNLNKIYFYKNIYSFSPEHYNFLQPLQKFHLLKSLKLQIDAGFLSQFKGHPDPDHDLFKLQLEELELDLYSRLGDEATVAHATIVLSSLFESSKNSLKKLVMIPLGNLHHLQFPRFTNLISLQLVEPRHPQDTFFPPGVRSLDIFSAVLEMDLPKCDWSAAFPHLDSIPVFPRVQNLSVNDTKFTRDSVGISALLCPNLQSLKIHRDKNSCAWYKPSPQINFLEVGRQIWTEMRQLESLEIDLDVDLPENNAIALDSCFTGISLENVQRLHDLEMTKTKKTLDKSSSQVTIPEAELRAEREHPSILDMTNLKTLTINAYVGRKLLERTDFFRDTLTWVSEEYAFKFLPHLKPKPKPQEEPAEKIEFESESE